MTPALPSLSPSALLPQWPPARIGNFPIDLLMRTTSSPGRDVALYYLARTALFHGLRALGIGSGDVVLMPAYHHGVEVETVRATGAGVHFYAIDRRFQADLDDLRRLSRALRTRALYLTHFLGLSQPLDPLLAWARERGLLVIEDCALALLSRDPSGRSLGSHGDLAIFCLYKSVPVPHGGLAVSRVRLPRLTTSPWLATCHHLSGSLLARCELVGAAPWLRQGARWLSRSLIDRAVPPVPVGRQHLRTSELHLGASRIVPHLLRRFDFEQIAVRRRRNYHRLLAMLDERAVPSGALPPGTVPLFLPLAVADRQLALAHFHRARIEAVDFWRHGDPSCQEDRFADTRWLRRHVIELPIHQDLDDEVVDQIGRVAREVRHA